MKYIFALICIFLISCSSLQAHLLQKVRSLSAALFKKQNILNNSAYSGLLNKAYQEVVEQKDHMNNIFKKLDSQDQMIAKKVLCLLHQMQININEKLQKGGLDQFVILMGARAEYEIGLDGIRNRFMDEKKFSALLASDTWQTIIQCYGNALSEVQDSFIHEASYKSADEKVQLKIDHLVLKKFHGECFNTLNA